MHQSAAWLAAPFARGRRAECAKIDPLAVPAPDAYNDDGNRGPVGRGGGGELLYLLRPGGSQ